MKQSSDGHSLPCLEWVPICFGLRDIPMPWGIKSSFSSFSLILLILQSALLFPVDLEHTLRSS